MVMKEVKRLYSNKNISYEVTKLIQISDFKNNDNKIDLYLKALRQDLNKIFLVIDKIDNIYENYENESSVKYESNLVAIYIEYIFGKYRTILDYIYKIADVILNVRYPKAKLKDYERFNILLDLLKNKIKADSYKANLLNTLWFNDIRKTRNSIIHNGATCMVFDNSKKKLFQVYDLEVNELIFDMNIYLHDGNCIYFDYYITLNLSLLIYFIKEVFDLLASEGNINDDRRYIYEKAITGVCDDDNFCQKSYIKWLTYFSTCYND